jgi:hypothetical protein
MLLIQRVFKRCSFKVRASCAHKHFETKTLTQPNFCEPMGNSVSLSRCFTEPQKKGKERRGDTCAKNKLQNRNTNEDDCGWDDNRL